MANHVNPGVLPTDDFRRVKTPTRISWGAIFAGVVIAIAIQLVLGILGTGIGLSLVDPVEGTTPGATGFGIGAGIYWIITTIIALGAGGYAAARGAGVHDRFDGLIHGLVVWGVTLIPHHVPADLGRRRHHRRRIPHRRFGRIGSRHRHRRSSPEGCRCRQCRRHRRSRRSCSVSVGRTVGSRADDAGAGAEGNRQGTARARKGWPGRRTG
ncbi:hypothetical protein NHF48_009460 [Sphingomonas sp. H160509]|uniref:hypothetical protein n=1 Tax=Sphingomonas sp. H160509 TaxID=2955313 RepID=UPI002097C059|nr:hypothetical protein [Sphingomonas sp. H160509]MDD1451152.1 hypothetical protein [Sphingomonas sp. H160509]